jgi:predicted RNase H-like HicB family nuclease
MAHQNQQMQVLNTPRGLLCRVRSQESPYAALKDVPHRPGVPLTPSPVKIFRTMRFVTTGCRFDKLLLIGRYFLSDGWHRVNRGRQYFQTSRFEGSKISMNRFLVVIEKSESNFSAYSPDLPGCIAAGSTREEVEQNMHKAIMMHVQGLREDNLPVPQSDAFAEYMAV